MSLHGYTNVVGIVALAAILTSARAEEVQPEHISSFADLIRLEPPEVRAAKVTKLAEGGMVLSEETLPEAFDLLQSTKALNVYMDGTPEPLTTARLEAMERLVNSDKDIGARFRAAVLLYRYGRDGKELILQKLSQDHDLNAAEVFALNREPGTEQAIVDALAASNQRADNVIKHIGTWFEPKLRQAAYQALEQQHWKTPHVIAMPALAWPEQATELRKAFESWPYRDTTKLNLAAALVRVAPEYEQAFAFLRAELQDDENPVPLGKTWVIRAIVASKDKAFIPDLVAVIESAMHGWEGMSRDQIYSRRVAPAVAAMTAIIDLGGEVPVDLVPQVFAMVKAYGSDVGFEVALIRSGNPQAIEFARLRLNDEDVAKVKQLQQLKPVPKEFLPTSSRKWVWG